MSLRAEGGLFPYFPHDSSWSYEIQRLIDESSYGTGGDVGEIQRTLVKIKASDADSWFREWVNVAETVERLGVLAQRRNERPTAVESYLRASNYFRASILYLSPEDPREKAGYEKHVELFRRAAPLSSPKVEPVQIRLNDDDQEERMLNGYLIPAASSGDDSMPKSPCLIVLGDANSTCEESYFAIGHVAAKRNLSVLLLDLPGEGASLRSKGMFARFDCETIVEAAIDCLNSLRRRYLDPQKIGIVGCGLGGYYAARAASLDRRKRIQAIALFGPVYNAVADLFDFFPPIRRFMIWSTGSVDSADARRKLFDFNLEGLATSIECPILINQASFDYVCSPIASSRLYDAVKHKNKVIKIYQGFHGMSPFRAEAVSTSLDWLGRKLREIEGD